MYSSPVEKEESTLVGNGGKFSNTEKSEAKSRTASVCSKLTKDTQSSEAGFLYKIFPVSLFLNKLKYLNCFTNLFIFFIFFMKCTL